WDRPHVREPSRFLAEHAPAPFRALLSCALHENPGERHRDAAEFRDALRAIELAAQSVHPEVEIRIPGTWLCRSAADPEGTAWLRLTETPARVALERDHVYRLRVPPDVQDEDLARLSNLGHLTAFTELSLAECRQVSNAGLAHLRPLVHLHGLDLRACSRITGAGLANLRALPRLRTVELAGCE